MSIGREPLKARETQYHLMPSTPPSDSEAPSASQASKDHSMTSVSAESEAAKGPSLIGRAGTAAIGAAGRMGSFVISLPKMWASGMGVIVSSSRAALRQAMKNIGTGLQKAFGAIGGAAASGGKNEISARFEKMSDVKFGKLDRATMTTEELVAHNKEMFSRLMLKDSSVYHAGKRISANAAHLQNYIGSADFLRHQQSAKVYYDGGLDQSEAQKMTSQREPVNIATNRDYDQDRAEKLLGNKTSYFEGIRGAEGKGTPLASVYSETYLWPRPDEDKRVQVAVLSTYAPALDSKNQPQFGHYVQDGKLNQDNYSAHMQKIASSIVEAAIDNKSTAFEGKGVQRLLLSAVGQLAFLDALSPDDKKVANTIFCDTLAKALKDRSSELKGISLCFADYRRAPEFCASLEARGVTVTPVPGDIKATAKDGDLIINAWDPHSAPGNGNDGDGSFDGHIGRSTGVLLSQTTWFNPALTQATNYKAV